MNEKNIVATSNYNLESFNEYVAVEFHRNVPTQMIFEIKEAMNQNKWRDPCIYYQVKEVGYKLYKFEV